MRVKFIKKGYPEDLWPEYEVLHQGLTEHRETFEGPLTAISVIKNLETGRIWFVRQEDFYDFEKYRVYE